MTICLSMHFWCLRCFSNQKQTVRAVQVPPLLQLTGYVRDRLGSQDKILDGVPRSAVASCHPFAFKNTGRVLHLHRSHRGAGDPAHHRGSSYHRRSSNVLRHPRNHVLLKCLLHQRVHPRKRHLHLQRCRWLYPQDSGHETREAHTCRINTGFR